MKFAHSFRFIPVLCLAAAACTTVTTVTGPVDARHAGQVAGQFYYLPKGLIRVKGGYEKDTGDYLINISASYVADHQRRYYLEPTHNVFYDDDVKLHAGSKGLLEIVNVSAEDKTADVLGDLASIAGGVLKFAAGVAPGTLGAPPAVEDKLPAFDYTFDLGELPGMKEKLKRLGFSLDVVRQEPLGATYSKFEFSSRRSSKTVKVDAKGAAFAETTVSGARETAPGVVFRPVTPYQVVMTDAPFRGRVRAKAEASVQQQIRAQEEEKNALEKTAKERPLTEQEAAALKGIDQTLALLRQSSATLPNAVETVRMQGSALLPDEDMQLLFTLGRSPFIKRTDNLVFVDGVLAKVEGTRPSPVVGFLQIPKRILTAIVPLPLEIRQTQLNNLDTIKKIRDLRDPAPAATSAAQ